MIYFLKIRWSLKWRYITKSNVLSWNFTGWLLCIFIYMKWATAEWQFIIWRTMVEWFMHRICVLMAEASECRFESWLWPWCLCPWVRHFTIIASLHPGVNGYLWGQSWLLCLIISPICPEMAAIQLYTSQWAEMVSGMILWAWWAGIIMYLDLVARICALYKNRVYFAFDLQGSLVLEPLLKWKHCKTP